MNNMKALLLRVGIDKGCGGALGPIFEDGSFEYIPIPEAKDNKIDNRTFSNTKGISGKYMADYLPKKIKNKKIHFDPEFETFTYGDVSPPKNNYLLKLEKNDLLVFYAGLTPYKNDKFEEALYIIAYFVVETVIDFNKICASGNINSTEKTKFSKLYSNNAHLKTNDLENLVIVVGNIKSRLMDHAILISERRPDKMGRNYHAVSPEMEKLLGIKGSIQRSIPPRMITDEIYLENLKKLMRL
jgi:hypothetical protein